MAFRHVYHDVAMIRKFQFPRTDRWASEFLFFSLGDETVYVSHLVSRRRQVVRVDFHAGLDAIVKPDFKIVPRRILKRPELSYITSA